jgi:hypothetical protein
MPCQGTIFPIWRASEKVFGNVTGKHKIDLSPPVKHRFDWMEARPGFPMGDGVGPHRSECHAACEPKCEKINVYIPLTNVHTNIPISPRHHKSVISYSTVNFSSRLAP